MPHRGFPVFVFSSGRARDEVIEMPPYCALHLASALPKAGRGRCFGRARRSNMRSGPSVSTRVHAASQMRRRITSEFCAVVGGGSALPGAAERPANMVGPLRPPGACPERSFVSSSSVRATVGVISALHWSHVESAECQPRAGTGQLTRHDESVAGELQLIVACHKQRLFPSETVLKERESGSVLFFQPSGYALRERDLKREQQPSRLRWLITL